MRRGHGIVLCGGGTGGHIMPGLALAAACRALGAEDVRWIGDPDRLEAQLVPQANIPLLPWGLSRPRLRSPRWWMQALRRAWHCWRSMRTQPPRVVVALGGYAALLPGLLAALQRRPLVVLEQNAWPGRTNRLLARVADVVVTQFAEVERHLPRAKARRLGNPVRAFPRRLRGQDPTITVLIMGGSLSARSLNDAVSASAPALSQIGGVRIIHLAGADDCQRMAEVYAQHGLDAQVHAFIQDMEPIYAAADLALCRAGATTVAECCSCGLGAIYIPLPWAAEDHQTANARAVARVGGAVVLPQDALNAASLRYLLTRLLQDRSVLRRLGERAASIDCPQAARRVALLCQAVVGHAKGASRW
ncbi:MAG: UDP-N-acetylglucosamine--N-acetylmuramyl-(pentapeptide) pyrophosphoryl-undecaprenol N-acetylglucosamine transferase [Planctomycetota bacterium]|nr:MAG: UDP-N-acetylglucosamine--N-acetylmuramyl-(pentapeptide) pyrophosphoryl-undecaprenol N-acetylglucosamine transferase [Planctomycetota bacterium]